MYKCWNLPWRKGNPATYLVCHFAELPLKEEGPGLNSTHPFHIPLNFGFDRKVANNGSITMTKREPKAFHNSSQRRGLVVSLQLNQAKGAGAGPGWLQESLIKKLGANTYPFLLTVGDIAPPPSPPLHWFLPPPARCDVTGGQGTGPE